MFFYISINFLPLFFEHHFWCNQTLLHTHQLNFTIFMGVSCKSFFLPLVILHILLNQNVAILYSSLKMTFCHFPAFHARCIFLLLQSSVLFFAGGGGCFVFSLSTVYPLKFFGVFFPPIILCILKPDWLLRLHSIVACLAVNFGLPTKILTIFHLSCLTCEVFQFSLHLKHFLDDLNIVSWNSQLPGYLLLGPPLVCFNNSLCIKCVLFNYNDLPKKHINVEQFLLRNLHILKTSSWIFNWSNSFSCPHPIFLFFFFLCLKQCIFCYTAPTKM